VSLTTQSGAVTDGAIARAFGTNPPAWTINGLAARASRWHERQYPACSPWSRLAKPAEEAGELVGAVVRIDEERGDPDDLRRRAIDEAVDVLISATGALEALGVTDVDSEIARRWSVVAQRGSTP
jgi:hypothetical protein